MSAIAVGTGHSGRKTREGYDLPTKRLFTWLILGKNKIQETANLTEDGGTSIIRICTGLAVGGPRPQGTNCS